MKLTAFCLVTVVLAGALPSLAAQAGAPALSLEAGLRDLEQQAGLGAALSMRPASEAELNQLQQMADHGLAAARAAAADAPGSAEAHYLLGSWLLYGYRVVEARTIVADAHGVERVEVVRQPLQGLSDEPDEGLEALRRAAELAPTSGRYLLDYAAALGDYGRPSQAMDILKRAWAGDPPLDPEQRMRAGLLISDLHAGRGELAAARSWVYQALAALPQNAEAVERLRWLDVAEAQAAAAAAAEPEEPEWEEQEWEHEGEYEESEGEEWWFDSEAEEEVWY